MASRAILEIDSPDKMILFGRRLGTLLFPGAVVALIGPLGAGKTFLVRAIAVGMGIADSRMVNSPTFVLIQEYAARLPIFHFDAYRLGSAAEFAELGVHEYFESDGVSLVEWADRVEACLPSEHLRLTIEATGAQTRRVTLEAFGERYAKLAACGLALLEAPGDRQAASGSNSSSI